MAKLAAKTYGDAFVQLAVEENLTDALFEEVTQLCAILKENTQLAELMNHPGIVKEEKMAVLERVFQDKVSVPLMGLMKLLLSKNHYDEMEAVLEYFLIQMKEYKKIGTVYVTTAFPLNQIQKDKVEKKLLKTTSYKSLEMHYEADKSLLGGMIIRIGDRILDDSVKTKIEKMSRELSKIQLKVGESIP